MVVGLTAAERARRVAALVAPKRSLANLAKRNLSQLAALVKTRLKRMQYQNRRSMGHALAPGGAAPQRDDRHDHQRRSARGG